MSGILILRSNAHTRSRAFHVVVHCATLLPKILPKIVPAAPGENFQPRAVGVVGSVRPRVVIDEATPRNNGIPRA